MAPIAFAPFEFWSVAFVLGLMCQNLWIVMGLAFVYTNAVVWISDHSADSPDVNLIFHIWFMLAAFVGALTGTVVASALRLRRTAFLSNLSGGGWTQRTAWVFVLLVCMLLGPIGFNIGTCRVCVGGAGMSPIGLPVTTAHIVGWICFGLAAFFGIVSLFAMYPLADARGSVSAKYLLTGSLVMLSVWVHDLIFFPAATFSVVPGFVYLVVLIFTVLVFAFVAYWIPASPTAGRIDENYRNVKNTRRLVLAMGLILLVGALAVLITIWVSSYEHINAALIVLASYSILVIIAVMIYGARRTKTCKINEPYTSLQPGMSVQDQLEWQAKQN